jgi:hypothetical protein
MAPTLCAGCEPRSGMPWPRQATSPGCGSDEPSRDPDPSGPRVCTTPSTSRPHPGVFSPCRAQCQPTLVKLNKVGRFIVEIDGDGAIIASLAGRLSHGSSSGQMVRTADDPTWRNTCTVSRRLRRAEACHHEIRWNVTSSSAMYASSVQGPGGTSPMPTRCWPCAAPNTMAPLTGCLLGTGNGSKASQGKHLLKKQGMLPEFLLTSHSLHDK